MDEYAKDRNKYAPYAVYILDYLRATALCETLLDVVSHLEKLSEKFTLLRVKDRLFVNEPGNKTLLVNLVVELPEQESKELTKCKTFTPSWWAQQNVKMICEVQISVREIFYLDKHLHAAYPSVSSIISY